jgi:hypothetical protein
MDTQGKHGQLLSDSDFAELAANMDPEREQRGDPLPDWLYAVDDDVRADLLLVGVHITPERRQAEAVNTDTAAFDALAAKLLRRAAEHDAELKALERRRDAERAMVDRAYQPQLIAAERRRAMAVYALEKIAPMLDYGRRVQSKQFTFGKIGYENAKGGQLVIEDEAAAAAWMAGLPPDDGAADALRLTVKLDLPTARAIDALIHEYNRQPEGCPPETEPGLPLLEETGELKVMVKALRKWWDAAKERYQGEIPPGTDITEAETKWVVQPVDGTIFDAIDAGTRRA